MDKMTIGKWSIDGVFYTRKEYDQMIEANKNTPDNAYIRTLLRQIEESALDMCDTEENETDMETIKDNIQEIKDMLKD